MSIRHCVDTIMNLPPSCSSILLLPREVRVDAMVPYHLDGKAENVYSQTLDRIYNGHNVAAIISLLNFLFIKLVSVLYSLY